jgi:hypothetical protein
MKDMRPEDFWVLGWEMKNCGDHRWDHIWDKHYPFFEHPV